MNSGFMRPIFGVTWQCHTLEAALLSGISKLSRITRSDICFHSVLQIVKLVHFIFIPLVSSFEQSARNDNILLVFQNMGKGKGKGTVGICMCSPPPMHRPDWRKLCLDALAVTNPLENYAITLTNDSAWFLAQFEM